MDVMVNVMEDDTLIERLVGCFAPLPQVAAIALGGSRASGRADVTSDVDLYVFTTDEIPLQTRRGIVQQLGGTSKASLGLDFWGAGDEWVDTETGIEVDAMYFGADWLEAQIERVWRQHQPSLGYTTSFCHTVKQARVFHDPNDWFSALHQELQQPYPEALRQSIVTHNHPVLRNIIPSCWAQLEKAVERYDTVSVNHRLAVLIASYFDIIFATNRVLHPGEKRLVPTALEICSSLPKNFEQDVTATVGATGEGALLLSKLTGLLDALDNWLTREGFDASASKPVHILR